MDGNGRDSKDAAMPRGQWLEHYADLVYRLWLQQEIHLGIGIAPDYTRQIEADLAAFYEHPLKRKFIETTYRSEVPTS